MAFFTPQSFAALLDELPIGRGDVVFVQSSLAALGPWRGVAPNDLPEAVIEALERRIGPDGVLVMPAFGYDFPRTGQCDLRQEPSVVGVLTERLRRMPGTLRSVHPMFSFVGRGAGAEALLHPDRAERHPFGPDSVLARLHEANALTLLLGAQFRTCTAFVYSERVHGAPYRFDKAFAGAVTGLDGTVHQGDFYHYCLPRSISLQPDYSRAAAQLLADGTARRIKAGLGAVTFFRCAPVHAFLGRELAADPWYLLSAPPEMLVTYANGVETLVEPGELSSRWR
ncbi:AAC(3) family N-acetyltransferase [Solidesulfovibrio carbinolicus]|nr:AAC(3) family N-acetyltransferase [Solidesulfovibrio carbinolicus]